MVFQNPALYPHLNVFDNLGFGLKARRVVRAERAASRSGRSPRCSASAGSWTAAPRALRRRAPAGGARAGPWPEDRPSCSSTSRSRASTSRSASRLRGELVELHDRFGSTLVHVTHDQAEALSLGQRLAVLHRGRLMQYGYPREIYERPAHRFVASFVGDPGMNILEVELGHDNDLRIVHARAAGSPSRPGIDRRRSSARRLGRGLVGW